MNRKTFFILFSSVFSVILFSINASAQIVEDMYAVGGEIVPITGDLLLFNPILLVIMVLISLILGGLLLNNKFKYGLPSE
jgi:hypothetical protein